MSAVRKASAKPPLPAAARGGAVKRPVPSDCDDQPVRRALQDNSNLPDRTTPGKPPLRGAPPTRKASPSPGRPLTRVASASPSVVRQASESSVRSTSQPRARSGSIPYQSPRTVAASVDLPASPTSDTETAEKDPDFEQRKLAYGGRLRSHNDKQKKQARIKELKQLIKQSESNRVAKEYDVQVMSEGIFADLEKKRSREKDEVEAVRAECDNKIKALEAELRGELDRITREGEERAEKKRLYLEGTGPAEIKKLADEIEEYRTLALEAAKREAECKKLNEELKVQLEEKRLRMMTTTATLEAEKAVNQELKDEIQANIELKDREAEAEERMKAKIQESTIQLTAFEGTRRRLHNQLEEIKGNIRVFCRIRSPTDDREVADFTVEDNALAIKGKERTGVMGDGARSEDHTFKYDRVFSPSTTNEEVFNEVAPLVQSCLDGFKVCIFAYGQTGSGKTYTMEGPPNNKGVIPRAVNMIFNSVSKLTKERGFTCSMSCSFLEIYNDQIRDLLAGQPGGKVIGRQPPKADKNGDPVFLKLRDDGNDVFVDGLSEFAVTDKETVGNLLAAAQGNRACAFTKMNDRSSRSHSVFQLKIKTHNPVTNLHCSGVLNLIDLAGSERVNASEVQGQRLKEAQAINKSLSHLGDAIHALGNGGGHVPFRNCTLTYLLKNSLGGSSKCLMFVNTSPYREHVDETLKSLRFAHRVNSTKVGPAKRSIDC